MIFGHFFLENVAQNFELSKKILIFHLVFVSLIILFLIQCTFKISRDNSMSLTYNVTCGLQ